MALKSQAVLLLLWVYIGCWDGGGVPRSAARSSHYPSSQSGAHVDDEGERLSWVMFDPLLPLGCGELWVGEVV